jgi:hypothetical protein
MLSTAVVKGQAVRFTRDDIEYVIELPSSAWHALSRTDVHTHLEFVYEGDRRNGYLRLRKNLVRAGTSAEDLFRRDEKLELRSLPGYIACCSGSGEKFEGNLSGLMFSYEYTDGGIPAAGRIYYLQADGLTFYSLHFRAGRDQFNKLRSQMDQMARSFRLK